MTDVLLALFFTVLFLAPLVLLVVAYRSGPPPLGLPRADRVLYAHGGYTRPVTPAEAWGLWHVFDEGPDRAVVWVRSTRRGWRVVKERP